MSEQQGRICPRGAGFYTWQSGDTLQSVASANNITSQALTDANPDIDFGSLTAGDIICVPAVVTTPCSQGQTYTVVRGDTLNRIANRFGVSVNAIYNVNPGISSSNLQVGMVICIPPRTVQPSPPVQTPVPSPCSEGYTAKTIGSGQTFASILVENDMSYYAMRQINPGIAPQNPTPGQVYCVPSSGGIGTCASGRRTYTIQGDYTLGELAAVLSTTQATLLQLNPSLKPGDFIRGQIICIP